jgi:hypothetical protein
MSTSFKVSFKSYQQNQGLSIHYKQGIYYY